MRKQQGIALLQVLLFTAILSVLALYFSQSARQQVIIAQGLKQQSDALINLNSVQAQLYFRLLTKSHQKQPSYTQTTYEQENIEAQGLESVEAPLPSQWNFYGEPFKFQDVEVTIQDHGGLLSNAYPDQTLVTRLLQQTGEATQSARNIVSTLSAWSQQEEGGIYSPLFTVDKLRFGPITDISDVWHIKGINTSLFSALKASTTEHKHGALNLLTAPEHLLKALVSSEYANLILENRKENQRISQDVLELIDDAEKFSTNELPSQVLTLTLSASNVGAAVKRQVVIKIIKTARGNTPPLDVLVSTGL